MCRNFHDHVVLRTEVHLVQVQRYRFNQERLLTGTAYCLLTIRLVYTVGACSGTGVRGCKGMRKAHLELRKEITRSALSGHERSRLRRACSCLRSTAVGL